MQSSVKDCNLNVFSSSTPSLKYRNSYVQCEGENTEILLERLGQERALIKLKGNLINYNESFQSEACSIRSKDNFTEIGAVYGSSMLVATKNCESM